MEAGVGGGGGGGGGTVDDHYHRQWAGDGGAAVVGLHINTVTIFNWPVMMVFYPLESCCPLATPLNPQYYYYLLIIRDRIR